MTNKQYKEVKALFPKKIDIAIGLNYSLNLAGALKNFRGWSPDKTKLKAYLLHAMQKI